MGAAPTAPIEGSRCNRNRLGKRQAAHVVGRRLRLACRSEERPRVGLQKLDPMSDVTRVAHVAIDRELGAQERRAQFGDKFLRRIDAVAETLAEFAVKARLVAGPMTKFAVRMSKDTSETAFTPNPWLDFINEFGFVLPKTERKQQKLYQSLTTTQRARAPRKSEGRGSD
jgi:hypothetical protein